MKITVYQVAVDEYGTDLFCFPTIKKREEFILDIIKGEWDKEEHGEMPEDFQTALDIFQEDQIDCHGTYLYLEDSEIKVVSPELEELAESLAGCIDELETDEMNLLEEQNPTFYDRLNRARNALKALEVRG